MRLNNARLWLTLPVVICMFPFVLLSLFLGALPCWIDALSRVAGRLSYRYEKLVKPLGRFFDWVGEGWA